MYIYIHTCIHVYILYTCVHIHTHTYIHTYIHTDRQTYIPHTHQLHYMCMHLHNKSKTIAGVAPGDPLSRTGSLLGFYNAGLYQGPNKL